MGIGISGLLDRLVPMVVVAMMAPALVGDACYVGLDLGRPCAHGVVVGAEGILAQHRKGRQEEYLDPRNEGENPHGEMPTAPVDQG